MTQTVPPHGKSTVLPNGGQVAITVRWADGQLVDCQLSAQRPMAANVLVGKTPNEVLALVPRLFSLCGQAQRAVAEAALLAANGLSQQGSQEVSAMLRRESIIEHLWRLMIDWPAALSCRDSCPETCLDGTNLQKKADNATFAHWYRRLRGYESADGLASALSAEISPALLRSRLDDLQTWERPLALAPSYLPSIEANLAKDLFACPDKDFSALPVWRSGAAEVGAMARFSTHPAVLALSLAGRALSARLTARWLALQDDIAALKDIAENGSNTSDEAGSDASGQSSGHAGVQSSTVSEGVGYAWTETARGPLCHRVRLSAGQVAEYLVIAPTEWNFHPQSAWAMSLRGARAETPEIAENLVRLWALALDPCVPVKITLIKEA